MGALGSGLEELRGRDVRHLSDLELESELQELDHAGRVVAVERARRVAEVERRGSFAASGHLSVTSWVETMFGATYGEAAREVELARGLEHMPTVRDALAEGEVSASAAGTLVQARSANPAAFSRSEDALLDAARTLPVRELRKAVEHWKSTNDPEQAARGDAERFERRGLKVSPGADRMVRVEGNLDPETGTTLLTALRSITDAWRHGGQADPRTAAQRRADALGELCRSWLDRSDRPVVGGERPHLSVVVDLATLEGGPGPRVPTRARRGSTSHEARPGGTSEGTRLPAETVRRLACDASVTRIIVSGRSEPLEAGRTTRLVSTAIRRALAVRDGGCSFPACDRPVGWCDAHHVRHWADGGPTDLANLVLLCRRHHTLTHSGFRIEMANGRPVFHRPDGTRIEEAGRRRPEKSTLNRLSLDDRAPP